MFLLIGFHLSKACFFFWRVNEWDGYGGEVTEGNQGRRNCDREVLYEQRCYMFSTVKVKN